MLADGGGVLDFGSTACSFALDADFPAWSALTSSVRSLPSVSVAKDNLEEKLQSLPVRSGVYIFKGADGTVLYIGKAKNLRSRVRSYFQPGSSDTRMYLPAMVGQVIDIETVVTGSEKEAAILENNLIKQQQPHFNVKLRDDKEFLTLRLNPNAQWPRLDLVRRPSPDGARYFGPYHSATSARRTLHLVSKHFQLRTCSDRELGSRTRPCLQYQIKRCPAPCVLEVDKQGYAEQVQAVGLFLEGRHDALSKQLESGMQRAAESMEYEQAAIYRDQLQAVRAARESQRIVSVTDRDQEVVGLYREGDLVELAVLSVRAGRMVEARSYSNPRVEVTDDEVIAAYIREQYGDSTEGAAVMPDELLLPVLPEGASGIAEWLTERRNVDGGRHKRVKLLAPQRGPKRQLLQLACDNARHAFDEKRRATEDLEDRLRRLQQRLRLPHVPRRIECTDISHLGGEHTVGSVVAMTNGRLDKKRYRTYKVRSDTGGDDYAAIYEVLKRRFSRGKRAQSKEAEDGWELPDLFVVDGGRGQLAMAVAAAQDLALVELKLAGLAKERENVAGELLVDRVYLPGQKNPISLRPNSPELFFLAALRDEAHRFANHGRKQSQRRRDFASQLDSVAGVGPKTKALLLRTFGSVREVLAASEAQLLAVRGVGRVQVSALVALRDAAAREPEGPAENQSRQEIRADIDASSPTEEPGSGVDN